MSLDVEYGYAHASPRHRKRPRFKRCRQCGYHNDRTEWDCPAVRRHGGRVRVWLTCPECGREYTHNHSMWTTYTRLVIRR